MLRLKILFNVKLTEYRGQLTDKQFFGKIGHRLVHSSLVHLPNLIGKHWNMPRASQREKSSWFGYIFSMAEIEYKLIVTHNKLLLHFSQAPCTFIHPFILIEMCSLHRSSLPILHELVNYPTSVLASNSISYEYNGVGYIIGHQFYSEISHILVVAN